MRITIRIELDHQDGIEATLTAPAQPVDASSRSDVVATKDCKLAEQTARFSHAPSLERARLVVEIAFPDRRRRDPHNYMATVKPIVDGLVDAGVLPDDDAKHLLGPDLRRHPEVTKKRLAQPVYEFHLSLYDRGGIS